MIPFDIHIRTKGGGLPVASITLEKETRHVTVIELKNKIHE